jgi:hypothetical protein
MGGPDLPGEGTPNIEVESAAIDQSYVFENLIQLYIYDFTKYVPMKLGPDGRYAYPPLALYWTDPERYPFIVKVDSWRVSHS